MAIPFDDLDALDEWLTRQAIDQIEHGVSVEDELIPKTVERLGQPCIYLYATTIFDGEVANGGINQFFDNTSGALAPVVRDALREMELLNYATIMAQIIDAFGPEYPRSQVDRADRIDGPAIQELLDRGYDTIDVWSDEFISARTTYARKNKLTD